MSALPVPAGHAAAAPGPAPAPAIARILAQAKFETATLFRNGEQLLVALILPAAVLVGLVQADSIALGDGRRVDLAVPGVLALCVVSSAFTGQAISTGFDRRYGVLRLLGVTPLGYVTVTPLQLANMMAAVANGGKLYRPYLVSKVESLDGATVREYGPELIRSIEMKPETLSRVQKALADVVHGPGGTGGAARSPAILVAGKTGTAQVIEMKGAYLKSEQLSYFNRDHAWFVSYAPVEKPRIAIAVLVEHGGHGGEAAAPMAKKVYEKFIDMQKPAQDNKQEARADRETHAN